MHGLGAATGPWRPSTCLLGPAGQINSPSGAAGVFQSTRKELETDTHDRRRRAPGTTALSPPLSSAVADRVATQEWNSLGVPPWRSRMQAPVRRRWRTVSDLTQCVRKRQSRRSCTQGPQLRARRASVCPIFFDSVKGCIPFFIRARHRTSKPERVLSSLRHKKDETSPWEQSHGTDAKENRAPHVDTKPESCCQPSCAQRGM